MGRRVFPTDGMIEIRVKKKAKKYKDGILLGSVIAPPFIGVLFLDVFAKHPAAGLAYIIGMVVWDVLFAIANRKKPRMAVRGRKPAHAYAHNFRIYSITDDADLSKEVAS